MPVGPHGPGRESEASTVPSWPHTWSQVQKQVRPPQSSPAGAQFPFSTAQEPAGALALVPGAAGESTVPPAVAPFSAGTSPWCQRTARAPGDLHTCSQDPCVLCYTGNRRHS